MLRTTSLWLLLVVALVFCQDNVTALIDGNETPLEYPTNSPKPSISISPTTLAPTNDTSHPPTMSEPPTVSPQPSHSPTESPQPSNSPTISPAPSVTPTSHNATISPSPSEPPSVSPAPSSAPTGVAPAHHVSRWGILGKTVAWLALCALSVLAFGALFSNRYRIYYYGKSAWYGFLRWNATRKVLRFLRLDGFVGGGAYEETSLNEIIFDNDLSQGLMMQDA
eukprot:scaffold5048_cov121-Cylindrotheca_fusiformis.AAC.13